MSQPSKTAFRVAAALAVLVLVVFGAVQVASAGPDAPGVVRTSEQPPLSAWAQEQAKLAGGPRTQATPQLVYAVVDNGVLTSQNFGASGATRVAVGTYEVYFGNFAIAAGSYVATLGIPGNVGFGPPGEVTTVGRVTTTNGLFVRTYDSTGVLADRAFHVQVAF
ncbi:hypothetical protein ABZ816_29845 [Actinosynnema sp. NPDC047251]|uniref:Putative secreted protein n=1 Tax=Saccharothrix espanaensis (strain ATCC 51144 / DSM 44229 / JCM 9112 / NBRC 15066 / NRRL 15764) TaxID=1179773 RepID=K0KB13_SACES|nr:hypothetical protein [Saccharothrix espanaensis]CCH34717.1 putative secreted protein [Saccharothrix espanaensis DSM 44229]